MRRIQEMPRDSHSVASAELAASMMSSIRSRAAFLRTSSRPVICWPSLTGRASMVSSSSAPRSRRRARSQPPIWHCSRSCCSSSCEAATARGGGPAPSSQRPTSG